MFKNLRFLYKILILALFIPVTAAIVAGIGLTRSNTLKYEYDNLYGFMLIPITNINQAENDLSEISAGISNYLFANLSEQEKKDLQTTINISDKEISDIVSRYESEWISSGSAEFTATLNALGQQSLQEDEANSLKRFKDSFASFTDRKNKLFVGQQVSTDSINQDIASMKAAMSNLVEVNMKFAELSNISAQNTITQMRYALIIAGVLATLFGLGFSFFLTRAIVTPVSQLTKLTKQLAVGDLDVKVTTVSKDEIGEMSSSFQEMVDYLKSMSRVADQIASGDLTVLVKPKTSRDVFGTAFSHMVDKLHNLITQVTENSGLVSKSSNQFRISRQL